jgi:hypothetical protein
MEKVVHKVPQKPFHKALEDCAPTAAGIVSELEIENRILIQEDLTWGGLFPPSPIGKQEKTVLGIPKNGDKNRVTLKK